jgi:hypothetical protein
LSSHNEEESENDIENDMSMTFLTESNRKFEERTSKSEDRTLLDDESSVVEERRRASSVDVPASSTKNSDLKSDFFHKLIAKATTDDDADTMQGSVTSLDSKNVDKTASTTSLDHNVESQKATELSRSNTSLEKVDGRQTKFSELSRSNMSLESTASHVASTTKYASCFSISRIKAHNIASFNEFNKETEQVRIISKHTKS